MNLSQYMVDPDAVVKVNGKILDVETAKFFGSDVDMGDCIAMRTPYGLITVSSKNPSKPARTIQQSRPKDTDYGYTPTPRRTYSPRY